ncbi:MAG: DUF2065 domain-containing protein [Xanthomonadales bacterium]|nr:DUF2065 domain-containing protein [Xanthomonadales bacterium]
MNEGGLGDTLWIAGCLVFVFEGLVLALMPAGWQKMMSQMATVDPMRLRWIGVTAMLVGLVGIKLLTH